MIDDILKQQILDVILAYKPVKKVAIFGSRATGDNTTVSDIDLAIVDESWEDKDVNRIHSQLEQQVKTPLKFDVVNFYSLSKENLKQDILSKGIIIYES